MKIAIFASAFHPHMGGVEELCRQLAHEYQRLGHETIILTNRWPRDLPAFECFEGLCVYRPAFRVPDGGLRVKVNYHLTTAAIRRDILKILRKHHIDIIHVQCVSANAMYAADAAGKLGLPLVVTLQGELTMDASQIFQRSAFARSMLRDVLDAADAITACSAHTLAEAETFYGKPFGSRGSVIHNGIRMADFSAKAYVHSRPYVLAIGRHVPQKGFDVLLHAFALALRADSPLPHDLLLAGDGPANAELRALAAKLGIAERVHFLGRTDRPTTASLFVGCDFFILPSRHEPQGIVNLEAMACGKPVIATRVGGVPEIVLHEETGILVAPGDSQALSAAILRLTHQSTIRARLRAGGLTRAKQFDWSAIAQDYLSVNQLHLRAAIPNSPAIRSDFAAQS